MENKQTNKLTNFGLMVYGLSYWAIERTVVSEPSAIEAVGWAI